MSSPTPPKMVSTARITRHSTGSVFVARPIAAHTPHSTRPCWGRTSPYRLANAPPGGEAGEAAAGTVAARLAVAAEAGTAEAGTAEAPAAAAPALSQAPPARRGPARRVPAPRVPARRARWPRAVRS